MKTITINTATVLAVLALALGVFAVLQGAPKAEAVGPLSTNIGLATTTTAVTVTSSTRVLATTTNALGNGTSYTRKFATICNPSTTVVYLLMNGDKPASLTAANVAIAAAAGYNACYQITDVNQYNGSVTASSTNQTSTSLIVTDYVQ